MTFTYDLDTDIGKVRFKIGDTVQASALVTDEEIEFTLSDQGDDVIQASIACCRAILAKWSREFDRNNVGMSASRSQRFNQMESLIADLVAQSSRAAAPFFGGTSISESDDIAEDEDVKQSPFDIDRDTYQG